MTGLGHQERAGATASPPGSVLTGDRSELVNIGHIEDPGVDFGVADIHPVELHVAVDVDPADIGTQRALVADREIEPGMQRDTPGIIKAQAVTGKRALGIVIEEIGIVDARADEGREAAAVGEVILQRERGRQVLDVADLGAVAVDVVAERSGGQQLDPDIVHDEVFDGDRGADPFVDVDRGRPRERAVVVLGHDDAKAEADSDVALFLCKRRGGGRGQKGGEDEGCDLFHGLSTLVLTGAGMRAFSSNHFDVYQVAEPLLNCGEIATGGACPAQMRETATCN